MASRAIAFVNDIDGKQKKKFDKVQLESSRISQIVTDFNVVNAELQITFADIRAKMEVFYEQTQASATKAGKEANSVHDEVTQLDTKTHLCADQTIAEIKSIKMNLTTECDKLRADVTTWLTEYAKKVESMVRTGNFSLEGASAKTSSNSARWTRKRSASGSSATSCRSQTSGTGWTPSICSWRPFIASPAQTSFWRRTSASRPR